MIRAQSISHTSNKICTMLFIPEGYIRNQHDYEKYQEEMCLGVGNILSIEEVREEFNKDLLFTCSVLSPKLGSRKFLLILRNLPDWFVASPPLLVGWDYPSGMEAAEKHILPRIWKTHPQHGKSS